MQPVLAGWDKKYREKGLVLIDVDDGDRDTLEVLKAHASDEKVAYAILCDGGGRNCKAYGIQGYPAAFLLDASGKVLWEGFPLPQVEEVEKLIGKALADVKDVPKGNPKDSKAKDAQPPKEPKTVTTASGLKFQDLKAGEGASPKSGSEVTVHYTGWLENGTKFDSSVDRGEPFQFRIGLGQVIKGWDEGVLGMKVGGKRKLIIPAALGYGDRGAGALIPPGATLVFEVELLGVR